MASPTKRTKTRRKTRESSKGKRRKRETRAKGSTPKFSVHSK